MGYIMNVEDIQPFVRFASKQVFSHGQKNMLAYDHRIYFCLKNFGTVTIGGKTYELAPNTFILWRAGTPYTYSANNFSEPIEVATCNFDFTQVAKIHALPIPPSHKQMFNKKKIVSEKAVFETPAELNGIIYLPGASSLRSRMSELCEEYKNKNNVKYSQIRMNTLLCDVLLQVARLIESKAHSKTKDLIDKILSHIQEEYKNNPSNISIGQVFGYHPNYINALIVKKTGITIHQHVINCKMYKAIELLMSSDLNIREIAEAVNIPDPQYFSRLFKKTFNKTPSSFRHNI